MDMDAFKPALKAALQRLPREVMTTIPGLVVKHLPVLEKVMPAVQADLAPHIGAAMAEYPFTMDKDAFKAEMMKAVTEVLADLGIDVPAA